MEGPEGGGVDDQLQDPSGARPAGLVVCRYRADRVTEGDPRGFIVGPGFERGQEKITEIVEVAHQDVFLGTEVAEERGARDPGDGADVLHRGFVVAPLHE